MYDPEQKAIEISFRLLNTSMKLTKFIMLMAINSFNKDPHKQIQGKQSLEKLSAQNKELASQDIERADIADLKREFKKLAVDFSIVKEHSTGEYRMYFKGQDMERVQRAMEKVVETQLKKEKKPVREVLDKAVEKAREQNEKIPTKEKNKEQEK